MKVLHHLTPRNQSQQSLQRGFYIGPAIATIFIVLVVSLASYGIFQYIKNTYTVYIENTNLMAVVSGAKSLKTGGSYANVDNAALQRIKAFGSMTGSSPGGTVRNSWDGTVVVSGTVSQLSIQYNGVAASACDSFLAKAASTGEFAAPLPTCNESTAADLTFIAY